MDVMRRKIKFVVFGVIVAVFLTGKVSFSQTNYLNTRISVSFTDIPLEKALTAISEQGNFTFSYNSKNFDEQRLVSLQSENRSVAKTLDELFDHSVKYKVVGTHVILNKKNPPKSTLSDTRPNEYIITGYIIDSQTGEKIQEATIYEIDGRVVSLSNSNGYYSITVPSEKEVHGLSYSKHGYLDTVIMVEPAYKKSFNIYLNPNAAPLQKMESVNPKLEDFHNRPLVDILVPDESQIISDNLSIHDNRDIQVSLLPFIGTNRKLSGSMDNSISINIIAGYSGGVNGFEMGGLVNITRRDVNGSQIAGFANLVGGNTNPFQMAGMFNLNGGSVTGTQIAGMSNVVLDTLNGVQLAGFNNTLHGYMNGAQLSGFNNVTTQNVDGIQLTGYANVALKDVELGQIAGFANYCDNVNGGQAAGFANVAKGEVNWGQIAGFANYGNSVKGLQLAGFANYSKGEVTGGQIAGFGNYGKSGGKYQLSWAANIAEDSISGVQLSTFNYTKKVKGIQIGFINIADTIESGVQIGILSFASKGIQRLEVSTDELLMINARYLTGTKRFYNIIKIGYDFNTNVSAGYGIGTQLRFKKNMNVHLELQSDLLWDKSNSFKHMGNINKFTSKLDIQFGKDYSLFIGPAITWSDITSDTGNFKDIAPYSIYSHTSSDSQNKLWIGGVFGLSLTL